MERRSGHRDGDGSQSDTIVNVSDSFAACAAGGE